MSSTIFLTAWSRTRSAPPVTVMPSGLCVRWRVHLLLACVQKRIVQLPAGPASLKIVRAMYNASDLETCSKHFSKAQAMRKRTLLQPHALRIHRAAPSLECAPVLPAGAAGPEFLRSPEKLPLRLRARVRHCRNMFPHKRVIDAWKLSVWFVAKRPPAAPSTHCQSLSLEEKKLANVS